MRTLLLGLLFISMTISPQAHAAESGTDFCHEWFAARQSGTTDNTHLPTSSLALVLQTLKIKFFPKAYSAPEFREITPSQPATGIPSLADGRNVIFYLGAPPETLARESLDDAQAALHAQQQTLMPALKKILKLTRTADLASCVALEQSLAFNYDDYLDLMDENGNLRDERQIANDPKSLKFLKRAIHGSDLNWETQVFTDLQSVYTALLDPKLENVIIVSHGQSNSKILDSRWNEYPEAFFNSISPNLRSINFYSCNSQKVPEKYDLIHKFSAGSSAYSTRLVTTVRTNPSVYDSAMAPLNGFSYYLKQLEAKLAKLKEQDQLAHQVSAPAVLCSASVSVPEIKKGTYAFFLNLNYIGSVSSVTAPQDKPIKFSFPCSLIKSGTLNIVTNRNIRFDIVTPEISGAPFEILEWKDPVNGTSVKKTDHYPRTGPYQSSKWEISNL